MSGGELNCHYHSICITVSCRQMHADAALQLNGNKKYYSNAALRVSLNQRSRIVA